MEVDTFVFAEVKGEEGEMRMPAVASAEIENDSQQINIALVSDNALLESESGQIPCADKEGGIETEQGHAVFDFKQTQDLSTEGFVFRTGTEEQVSNKDGSSFSLQQRDAYFLRGIEAIVVRKALTDDHGEEFVLVQQDAQPSLEVWPETILDGATEEGEVFNNDQSNSVFQKALTDEHGKELFAVKDDSQQSLEVWPPADEHGEELFAVKQDSQQSLEVCPKTILDDMEIEEQDCNPISKDEASILPTCVPEKPTEEFVRTSFTCDTNTVDEDELLREHWTRTLQTSTSTGEIVEEIVRVLKHQKTHDLLCPVCGSCITKRVVLRKRKRSSLISVDRWYRAPSEEGAEIPIQASSIETVDSGDEQEDSQLSSLLPASSEENRDTEAFGCLACFSLFFRKGQHQWNKPEADDERDTFSCLPFFFPPYPWGMSRSKKISAGKVIQSSVKHETFSEVVDTGAVSDYPIPKEDASSVETFPIRNSEGEGHPWSEKITSACGLAPGLCPDYPWGTKSDDTCPLQGLTKNDPQTKAPKQEKKMTEVEDITCDLTSVVLPAYSWGNGSKSKDVDEVSDLQIEHGVNGNGNSFQENGSQTLHGVASTFLPPYPWGRCSEVKLEHENGEGELVQKTKSENNDNGSAFAQNGTHASHGAVSTFLPAYPWGKSEHDDMKDKVRKKHENFGKQEAKVEVHFTSTSNFLSVTSAVGKDNNGKVPPQVIGSTVSQQIPHTIQSVGFSHMTTVLEASVESGESSAGKTALTKPLASVPSTGFALLDSENPLPEKGMLASLPSTGYALFEGMDREPQPPIYETQEIEQDLKSQTDLPLIPPKVQNVFPKTEKTKIHLKHTVWQFFSFLWLVGKVPTDDLAEPLLKTSEKHKGNALTSVSKPLSVSDGAKTASVYKVSKPSDSESIVIPPRPAVLESKKKPGEEFFAVVTDPPRVTADTVLDVEFGDDIQPAQAAVATAIATPQVLDTKQQTEGWEILRSIVYGGLDIAIVSLGVTSSAAGGDAITRTVVYMGLATLFSGIIGFYHNVLNLYHHHREHYTKIVGKTLLLHGTVAIVSYFLFGVVSPVTYAFSFRESDNRDYKFSLCCGVTLVSVILLSLGKAHLTNKFYLRTVMAYVSSGVLASVIGYLTGEHISELLESWGI